MNTFEGLGMAGSRRRTYAVPRWASTPGHFGGFLRSFRSVNCRDDSAYDGWGGDTVKRCWGKPLLNQIKARQFTSCVCCAVCPRENVTVDDFPSWKGDTVTR